MMALGQYDYCDLLAIALTSKSSRMSDCRKRWAGMTAMGLRLDGGRGEVPSIILAKFNYKPALRWLLEDFHILRTIVDL